MTTTGGPETFAARRAMLAGSITADGILPDVWLVTDRSNVAYLSGFRGSAGALLVDRDGDGVLAVDGRYEEQAVDEAAGVTQVTTRTYAATLLEHARDRGARTAAYEAHAMTVELFDVLTRTVASLQFFPAGRIVEKLRAVKADEEQACLRSACAVSETALQQLLAAGVSGRTEAQLAAALEFLLRDAGAEGAAFDSIVASGPNTALPHARPGGRVVGPGDVVLIDFGGRVGGYAADMTRMIYVSGPEALAPPEWLLEGHRTVRAAQEAAIEELCHGATTGGVAEAVRQVMEREGAAGRFLHGMGHCIGLDVHEQPYVGLGSDAPVREGMVFAVEPGIYLTGVGGVRLEDMVVVGVTPADLPPAADSRRSGRQTGGVAPSRQNDTADADPPTARAGRAGQALTTMTRDLIVLG